MTAHDWRTTNESMLKPTSQKINKRVALVTGAEGFIGSHLISFLEAKGWEIVATHMIASSPMSGARRPRVKFVRCDLRDRQRVEYIVRECKPSYVFHLGAQSFPTVSWTDPVLTFESNIMGSLHLFEAVRRLSRSPVVVSACSSAEYGNVLPADIPVVEEHPLRPLHPYGISKVCLDLLSRQYFTDHKIPSVNLRLFNTTGPGKTGDAPSDFVRQLVRIKKKLQAPVIEVGNLTPRRAFLDVNDTVRGFYLAALRGKRGETYNICANKTYSIGKLLQLAMRLSDVDVAVRPLRSLMRPSDEKIIFGSTEKFRRQTGWKPICAIEDTLKSMLDYWNRTI